MAVSDEQIKALYDVFKWGPTGFNGQPARFVFIKSQRLALRWLSVLMRLNPVSEVLFRTLVLPGKSIANL